MAFWQTTRFRLDLGRPLVMGIVNVTPDSFSDGGRDEKAALLHCERLLREGADILDIGGESTRPGSASVPVEQELARVLPVVKGALALGVPISVDTLKPQVMLAVLDLGADIINDVNALSAPGALTVVAAHASCGVCLMHMQGTPATMQQTLCEGDVVGRVRSYLDERAAAVRHAGVAAERIVLDPGIGFGKRVEDNFALISGQHDLLDLGYPLLAGWSRKSSLGAVTGRPLEERLPASIAAALAAISCGASVIRVHDVAATVDAVAVWRAAGLL